MLTVMTMVRKDMGITQIDLANEIGITQAEVSMIERGKVTPREETLDKAATILKTPKDELLQPYAEWLEDQIRAKNSRTILK